MKVPLIVTGDTYQDFFGRKEGGLLEEKKNNVIQIARSDSATGDCTFYREYAGDYRIKLTSENSIAAYKLLKSGRYDIYHTQRRYAKVYGEMAEEILADGLDGNEAKMFIATIRYMVRFYTGELVRDDNTPVTSSELAHTANLEQRTAYRAIGGLIRRRILDKDRRGRGFVYYANPFIYVCGNSVDFELLDRFYASKWAKFPIENKGNKDVENA